MWILALISLMIAITTALDIFTDITAIVLGNINAMELGLLNALSYFFFILSVYVGSKMADRGIIRLQVLFLLFSLLLYSTLLHIYISTLSIVVLVLLYALYAIAQAHARTSVYAYIHEIYSSNMWNSIHSRRIVITAVSEALLLLALSRIDLRLFNTSTYQISALFLAVSFMAFILIKDPVLKIEKTLYKIDIGLKRLEDTVINNLMVYTLLSTRIGFNRARIKPSFLRTKSRIHQSAILLILIVYKLSNALLLVQLPMFLNKSLHCSFNCVLFIYALARMILLLDFIIGMTSTKVIPLFILMRAILPLILIVHMQNVNYLVIIIVLGLLLYLNSRIDVGLYSIYIDTLGRVETTRYLLISEITGFMGTIISGILYLAIGYDGILVLTAIMLCLTCTSIKT